MKKELSYLKSVSSILSNCKLWAGVSKNYCKIWNQIPQICLIAKFGAKIKKLQFWTKNAWLEYFGAGNWKSNCRISNQLLSNFSKIFCAKKEILQFKTKNALFEWFWTKIWKSYCHNRNQCPQICLIARFGAKTKILKFGMKNAWFGYFWAGIWIRYCPNRNHLPIFLKAKFCAKKWKSINIGPKMLYLGVLGGNFEKLFSYFKWAPSNLTHTVNFGTGSTFFKGTGSSVSEGLCLGPQCKVFHTSCNFFHFTYTLICCLCFIYIFCFSWIHT